MSIIYNYGTFYKASSRAKVSILLVISLFTLCGFCHAWFLTNVTVPDTGNGSFMSLCFLPRFLYSLFTTVSHTYINTVMIHVKGVI